jgi:hypothetical protein
MKRIRNLAVLSAFVAMSGMTAASDLEERHHKHAPKELTKELALQKAADRFDRADLNKDGKLDRQEWQEAREKGRQLKKERAERLREKRQER